MPSARPKSTWWQVLEHCQGRFCLGASLQPAPEGKQLEGEGCFGWQEKPEAESWRVSHCERTSAIQMEVSSGRETTWQSSNIGSVVCKTSQVQESFIHLLAWDPEPNIWPYCGVQWQPHMYLGARSSGGPGWRRREDTSLWLGYCKWQSPSGYSCQEEVGRVGESLCQGRARDRMFRPHSSRDTTDREQALQAENHSSSSSYVRRRSTASERHAGLWNYQTISEPLFFTSSACEKSWWLTEILHWLQKDQQSYSQWLLPDAQDRRDSGCPAGFQMVLYTRPKEWLLAGSCGRGG